VAIITAVRGDITTIDVDAIVNAANNAMRGGGGVDGAIHRAGGPAILADCIERFPSGLATGDAGWTTAGELPARWVIHTVGPNYRAGQRDRALLESCYRRALEVADELGARSIAFPLISAGVYGWPRSNAIAVAVEAIAASRSRLDEVWLVAFDDPTYEEVRRVLSLSTPMRILQAVQVLHRRGYQAVRILPGMSASGMYWRVSVTTPANLEATTGHLMLRDWDQAINYTTGAGTDFAGHTVTAASTADEVADIMLTALPALQTAQHDPEYARWYGELMEMVERDNALPIAYADYFDRERGWEIGWGSGARHDHPPG
jgi:O-acetyl-ADP-ribose deacetylase (regulator of RNase III)